MSTKTASYGCKILVAFSSGQVLDFNRSFCFFQQYLVLCFPHLLSSDPQIIE